MLSAMKRAVRGVAPGAYAAVREWFWVRKRRRIAEVRRWLRERYGLKVMGGPFAGMTYVAEAELNFLPAKQLGAYEAELHPVLSRVVQKDYETVIDVGCAEGYYAVGLARALPAAKVYAYDVDPNGQRWCAQMAGANGVAERVIVGGACDHATLNGLPLEKALLFSDCEGYELDLLAPEAVPGLAGCDLIVELHDDLRPGLTAALLRRFEKTHEITVVPQSVHRVEDFPIAASMPAGWRELAVSDFRGEASQWAFFEARFSGRDRQRETTLR